MRYAFLLLLITTTAQAMSISKLSGTVTVDGDLSDDAWRGAQRVESFVEYFRGDNVAPPAKTTSYLAYDERAVYVAFVAHDPAPGAIRAPLVDRDKVLGDQDYVAILLDTQNDRRSGVAFRVNPRGVQTDSVVSDTSDEDFSPDFFYEAVARRTEDGWAAEMRIPLASLRYPAADPQTWGVILMRNYPRDFRYIMASTQIPKNSGCFLCHAASVTGFQGLPTGSHFTLTPYSSAKTTFGGGAAAASAAVGSRSTESDIGFDLKWNPSARLTIDTTLNPDFSQIEADVPQLAVNTRFALSYPEKRAFFLEGVDLLSTPIRAVYTRSVTSPAWGLRATGHSGANAYTFLLAEDRGGGTVILPGPQGSEFAPQDFRSRVAIGRLRRSFGDSFGAFMVSARENEGGGHNRLLGPDFLWQRSAIDKVAGQFLYSDTDGNGGHAYRVYYQRDARRYDIWAATSAYSPRFRADNGFVVQTGLRRGGLWLGYRTYPKSFLSYFRPYIGVDYDVAYDGNSTLRMMNHQGFEFQGKWGSGGWIWFANERERVGTALLARKSIGFDVTAVPSRWMPKLHLDGDVGQRIDYAAARVGNGARINFGASFRATDHLELQLTTTREWLDHVFDANIDWLKATYTFSPRTLVRFIAQQSEVEGRALPRDRSLSFSGLYAYKLNWQTVFFVGFGDSRITGDGGQLVQQPRSVFMKVAYALQR